MVAADPVAIVQPVSVAVSTPKSPLAANGSSGAASFSGDGRRLLFLSDAENLVSNDHNGILNDVFVQDGATGGITLVSVIPDGTNSGNAASGPASISWDGRQVVFASSASNLVAGDTNGVADIFLRDLEKGETRILSVGPGGVQADGSSSNPSVSADGRSVVFESLASNLVASPTGTQLGVFQTVLGSGEIRRLDVRPDGGLPNGPSTSAAQNTNGTVVVFRSDASDLVPKPAGLYTDLFVHRDGSPNLSQIVVPGATNGVLVPIRTFNVVLSADGRYLAFRTGSQATTSQTYEGVWWYDLTAATNSHASARLASFNAGEDDASGPEMTADGRTLAFQIWTTDGTKTSLRTWNADTGIHLLSDGLDGGVSVRDPATAMEPVLSPDGTRLAYLSAEAHPAAGITNAGVVHLYVRTLATGLTRWVGLDPSGSWVSPFVEFSPDGTRFVFQTVDVESDTVDLNRQLDLYLGSVDSDRLDLITTGMGAAPRMGNSSSLISTTHGAISDDGRRVVFTSVADNLIAGDGNLRNDAFVRDLGAGVTSAVSVGPDGRVSDQGARGVILSGSGRRAAFLSTSLQIIPGDSNRLAKVFVRDLDTGITVLGGAPDQQDLGGTGEASNPVLSQDGNRLLFDYSARDLVPNLDSSRNVFIRDIGLRRTYALVHNDFDQAIYPGNYSLGSGALSSDGSMAAFLAGSGPNSLSAYLCPIPSLKLSRMGLAGVNFGYRQVGLSGNGSRAFFTLAPDSGTPLSLYWWDVASATGHLVLTAPDAKSTISNVLISQNGRSLVFQTSFDALGAIPSPGVKLLFAFDISANQLIRVGTTPAGTPTAGGVDSPSISADGRFVAFRGTGSDLSPGDDNGGSDVFVKDLIFGTVTLLSRSPLTGRAGNNISVQPSISADGSRVVFLTFADDFVSGDLNQLEDVFVATVPQWLNPTVRRSSATALEIRWTTPPGTASRLERATSLTDAAGWTVLGTPVTGDGSEVIRVVEIGDGTGFLRVNAP